MQRLLRRACDVAKFPHANEEGRLKPSLIALIERNHDAVVAEGLAFHIYKAPLARSVTGGLKTARPCASPNRAQSSLASGGPQAGHAALPSRPGGPLHQQSGRARRPHDEVAPENLRRVPFDRRRLGLRAHPLITINRQEARLGHHRRPDRRSDIPAQIPLPPVPNQVHNLGSYMSSWTTRVIIMPSSCRNGWPCRDDASSCTSSQRIART